MKILRVQKHRIRVRAFWAQWSPAACAGLIAAGLVTSLVYLLWQAGH